MNSPLSEIYKANMHLRNGVYVRLHHYSCPLTRNGSRDVGPKSKTMLYNEKKTKIYIGLRFSLPWTV